MVRTDCFELVDDKLHILSIPSLNANKDCYLCN